MDYGFVVSACLLTFAASVIVSIGITSSCRHTQQQCTCSVVKAEPSYSDHDLPVRDTLKALDTEPDDGLTANQRLHRAVTWHKYLRGSSDR